METPRTADVARHADSRSERGFRIAFAPFIVRVSAARSFGAAVDAARTRAPPENSALQKRRIRLPGTARPACSLI